MHSLVWLGRCGYFGIGKCSRLFQFHFLGDGGNRISGLFRDPAQISPRDAQSSFHRLDLSGSAKSITDCRLMDVSLPRISSCRANWRYGRDALLHKRLKPPPIETFRGTIRAQPFP